LLARLADQVERRLNRDAILESDRVGRLDRRAVGDGVGEGDAELDYVFAQG
jgi:hypothetical protein